MLEHVIRTKLKEITKSLRGAITHGTLTLDYTYRESFENDGSTEEFLIEWCPHGTRDAIVVIKVDGLMPCMADIKGVLQDFTQKVKEIKPTEATEYFDAWPKDLYFAHNLHMEIERVDIRLPSKHKRRD